MKKEPKEVLALKGQLARALADYDNLVKRVERERLEFEGRSNRRLILKLLTVLDTLELAQKHLQDQGLQIAISQFSEILSEEAVEEVEEKDFNENLHEVTEVVKGGEKGKIAEVVLKGYKFQDGSVIRHSKVKVFAGKE